jgi:biotin synthase-like enzyme
VLAESEQAMCFMAGANAVFTGEQMLTTPCKRSILYLTLDFNLISRMTGSPWDEVSRTVYYTDFAFADP